ncbi:MAG: hypothetical protein VYA30_15825 [Myxococcota bacterium]|nr:hypothetical protein [Myxococcota bacterium]
MRAKHRALAGVLIGVFFGFLGAVWLQSNAWLTWPCESVLIGLGAGVGGLLGRAFGTPNQVRIVVFASLAAFCILQSVVAGPGFIQQTAYMSMFDIRMVVIGFLFFLLGLILGIRLWLGGDVGTTLDEYGRIDLD